ncbi:MAG: phytoene desaturase family protein, partial [Chloroflexota bacterium]
LAKAARKVLVVEKRPTLGGIAATDEIVPGFKYSTCAHLAGSFSAQVIADLNLEKYGLKLLPLSPLLFAPSLDGKSLLIPADLAKAAEWIGRHSRNDASRYAEFCTRLKILSTFLSRLYELPFPDRSAESNFSPAELIKIGWRFHRLGEKQMYEFLRILPMSAADLLNEWFESDLFKAALAGTSLLGSFVGPRQQGTAFNLLHHQLGQSNGALRTAGFVRGGIGRLADALAGAARQHGAEIRTGTAVEKIVTKSGAATGIVVGNGEEIEADTVVSSVDAKQTFLKLVEPTYLDPNLLLRVGNIRARGTVAKVNLALEALPKFNGWHDQDGESLLGGVIHVGPTVDYLERAADAAKYGRFSERPFLEITIPTIADPSLAPPGKHVMSVWMQFAPYGLRSANWHVQRDALGDTVVNLINDYAPGFKNSILHCQVLTPLDLEQTFGLTGGHPYHAELGLDQVFFMRPVPGWSRYHTPIKNLYLCGAAAHPGGGITGLPGHYAAKEILESQPQPK